MDLFVLAMFFGFGSFLLSIIELIAIHSFSSFFMKTGITVFKRTIDINSNDLNIRPFMTVKKLEGKFQFHSNNEVFFLSQFFFFKLFRFTTPFPFKAVGTIISNNKIDVKAKIPIGTTLLLFVWLIGFTVMDIVTSLDTKVSSDIGFPLMSWVFAGLLLLLSYFIELSRMETMISELEEIIAAHNKHIQLIPTEENFRDPRSISGRPLNLSMPLVRFDEWFKDDSTFKVTYQIKND